MAVSKRTRFEVLNRDNFTCRYCGQSAPDVKLHVDHVMPVSLGGADTPDNLVAACIDCNTGKASTNPRAETVAQVSEDAIRYAEAVKLAAVELHKKTGHDIERRREQHDKAKELFCVAVGAPNFNEVRYFVDIPQDWFSTFCMFEKRGLSWMVIGKAFQDAWWAHMENGRIPRDAVWRYFCGICWNNIREIEARAKDIYEATA